MVVVGLNGSKMTDYDKLKDAEDIHIIKTARYRSGGGCFSIILSGILWITIWGGF